MPFFPGSSSGGGTGPAGPAGSSAYQIAVANGFVGSEAAWLASLAGPAGANGSNGADSTVPGPAGPAGPAGEDGADGTGGGGAVTLTVHNATGVTIPAGSAIYLTGDATAGVPNASSTLIATGASDAVIGINEAAIANGATGPVVTSGTVTMNTSAWYLGSKLYIQSDADQPNQWDITDWWPITQPVLIGTVLEVGTAGKVQLNVDSSWTWVPNHNLTEHLDSALSTATNGQVAAFNSDTGKWAPLTLPAQTPVYDSNAAYKNGIEVPPRWNLNGGTHTVSAGSTSAHSFRVPTARTVTTVFVYAASSNPAAPCYLRGVLYKWTEATDTWTLVGQSSEVTVPNGTAYTGVKEFTLTTPVTLEAGAIYAVGVFSKAGNGGLGFYADGAFVTSSVAFIMEAKPVLGFKEGVSTHTDPQTTYVAPTASTGTKPIAAGVY